MVMSLCGVVQVKTFGTPPVPVSVGDAGALALSTELDTGEIPLHPLALCADI